MTSDTPVGMSGRHSVAVFVVAVLLIATVTGCSSGSSAAPDSDPIVETTELTTTTAAVTTTTAVPTTSTTAVLGSPPLAAGSLSGRIVVVDPGHNGQNYAHSAEINQQVNIGTKMKECDTSGTATYGGYTETAHNWDVAQRLSMILRNAGATVVFTRPDDNGWGPCITERAGIGNTAKGDLAVSIHADGGPDSGTGFHVLYPALITGMTEQIVEPSLRLAIAIRDAYARGTGMPYASYLGSSALMARSDLGGLNLSKIPKVFLEAGNMRNSGDAAKLTDPAFRQLEAEALAAGIVAYLSPR